MFEYDRQNAHPGPISRHLKHRLFPDVECFTFTVVQHSSLLKHIACINYEYYIMVKG